MGERPQGAPPSAVGPAFGGGENIRVKYATRLTTFTSKAGTLNDFAKKRLRLSGAEVIPALSRRYQIRLLWLAIY